MKTTTYEPLVPRHDVLLLTGYGLRLAVDRGHLLAEDGLAADRRRGRFPKVRPGFRRVVVLGHAGSVSLEALRWLHDLGIGLVHLGADADVVIATGPRRLNDPRLRRAQALASYGDVGLTLVRELVRRKIQGQLQLLPEITGSAPAQEHLAACLETLPDTGHVTDVRWLEASAAKAYWEAWRAVPVHFAATERRRVPAHWLRFGSRISPVTDRSRRAATPINALLNYLYAILEAEARIALLALGLDPGLGILHADQEARDSLALDVMEPARPVVDRLVLDLVRNHVFRKADFFEARDGVCRLLPPLTEQCVARSIDLGQAVAPHAEWLAHELSRLAKPQFPAGLRPSEPRGPSRERTVPAILTGSRRREARGFTPIVATPKALIDRRDRRCIRCGNRRSASSSSLCHSCVVEEAPGLKAANAAIKRQVQPGKPRFSRTANALRGRKISDVRAKQLAWDAVHPRGASVAVYRREILPRLKQAPVTAIIRASGMSKAYCSAVRAGRRVPHPVHWEALKAVVTI